MQGPPDRYHELDALRGLAFLLMAFYHLLFDLSFFYDVPIAIREGMWSVFARSVASLFLMLVGIGSAISLARRDRSMWWRVSMKRAGIVLACALLVTVVTRITSPEGFVRFGILHVIGVSALLMPLFFRAKSWNILLGLLVIAMTPTILSSIPASIWTLPVGATPPLFMLDYYPLLPWFGVILIGSGIGSLLYLPSPSKVLLPMQRLPYPSPLLWCGRRALFLYMVHQPVLLLALWIVLGKGKF